LLPFNHERRGGQDVILPPLKFSCIHKGRLSRMCAHPQPCPWGCTLHIKSLFRPTCDVNLVVTPLVIFTPMEEVVACQHQVTLSSVLRWSHVLPSLIFVPFFFSPPTSITTCHREFFFCLFFEPIKLPIGLSSHIGDYIGETQHAPVHHPLETNYMIWSCMNCNRVTKLSCKPFSFPPYTIFVNG
jgi:hypothetical protein